MPKAARKPRQSSKARRQTCSAGGRDVTELKEGLAVKQAAQLYQRLIALLPAGAVLREDSRITMNQSAEAITGYSRDELPTVDAWCSALHGEQAHEMRQHYETSRGSDVAKGLPTLPMTRKDGTQRRVEFTVSRLDETRELWLLRDVSELLESESRLQSIVSNAVDAIITIDERGTIETFNPAAERMFAYTTAEAVGQNVSLLMPPPYHDEHDGYLARYLRTREARIIGIGREVVGLRKDGTTFPLDLAVGEIDHRRRFTGTLRDISDRRKLEWRLAESQVEERLHMARELHDEMGGHITGIGMLAHTLQARLEEAGSPLAVKAEDLVKSIDEAHTQLRSVVRGLMPVEAMPEGLMAALQHLAKQAETVHDISCQFQCDPPIHLVDMTAATHLFRITQEALNNAVRHGKPRHVAISLTQTEERLEVAVADDGTGLKQIPGGHAGMGMHSMRERARLLGGDLTVRAREGGGTVVACRIPYQGRGIAGVPVARAMSGW
jgi:PAS domain S-box-containing protein